MILLFRVTPGDVSREISWCHLRKLLSPYILIMRVPPSPAGGFDNGLIMVVVNFTKRPMGTIGDDPNFYPSQIKHLFIPPYIHSTSTLTVFHGQTNTKLLVA